MIDFLCSGCGKNLKVKDEFAGRKGRCPHCQRSNIVPSVAVRAASVQADSKDILPDWLGEDSDAQIASDSTPRGNCAAKKNDTANGNAELYDFLAPAQESDELGRLGCYRVLKVLGAGGMGVVFQAEDPKLHRLVAIKAMLPGMAASPGFKERFFREARTAAAIEHDHIVAIFQVDEDRGVPFIAMPFLRGESLEDRLHKERKLPIPEALRIVRETAEGLSAAHERGMIHRDIKPANIWLEGDKGRAKILDFGLARSTEGGDSGLTQQGAIIGTPQYMAPEQSTGKAPDARCDLFSLGCVLYRATTGQLPFKGADMVSTLLAVATRTPKPPRKLNPLVSPRLSELIESLLSKDAKDRPASAQVVVKTLEELEKEPPVDPNAVVEEEEEPAAPVKAARKSEEAAPRKSSVNDSKVRERAPRKQSASMTPMLLGGGVGVLGLLAAVLALVLVVKNKNKPNVVANADTPAAKTALVNPPPPPPAAASKQKGKEHPKSKASSGPKDNNKENKKGPKKNTAKSPPKTVAPKLPQPVKTHEPFKSAIRGLLLAPDAKHFFAFAEHDSHVKYWDLQKGKEARSYDLGGDVGHFLISSDGKRLIAYNDSKFLCWNVGDGKSLGGVVPLPGFRFVGGGFPSAMNICAALTCKGINGEPVVVVYVQGYSVLGIPTPFLEAIDSKTNRHIRQKNPKLRRLIPFAPREFPHKAEAEQVFFSPDCQHFLSWSKDHKFRTWTVTDPSQVVAFPAAPGEIQSISISPDFKWLTASFHQADVHVYDVESGQEVKQFKPQGKGNTEALSFGGSDSIGVAATVGAPTRLYDMKTGAIKKEVKGIASTTAVALSADGKTILCGDKNGKVHVFKLK